jgi:protein-S-isoprenylcysteine O-methyltransferase Ste14
MVFPKSYAELVARVRVPTGILLALLFVWLSCPNWDSLAIGTPWALLGIVLRGWAAGHLEKNIQLTTSGPFARVRNPLYLGSLLVGIGFALAAKDGLLAVLIGIFFLGFYLPVVEEEERHLNVLFPGYRDYQQRVPKLIPQVRTPDRGGQCFRWQLYFRNREYQALLAFLLAFFVLAQKAL